MFGHRERCLQLQPSLGRRVLKMRHIFLVESHDSIHVPPGDGIVYGIEITLRRGVSCKSRMLASNPVAAAQMYEGPFAQMARRLRWIFLGC